MRRFYTTFEAAHLLGVSLPTVVNWIKARRIKAHRTPGGHRRIAREDLAAFMLRHGMPIPAELSDAAAAPRKALVIAAGEPNAESEAAARQLGGAGYAVEKTAPGFHAGVALARFRPDVVVLCAASADGGDTLKALRADGEASAVPVVAVGHPDWLARLRTAGCSAAVSRPLLDGALGQAAAEALQLAPVARRAARKGAR